MYGKQKRQNIDGKNDRARVASTEGLRRNRRLLNGCGSKKANAAVAQDGVSTKSRKMTCCYVNLGLSYTPSDLRLVPQFVHLEKILR